MDFQDQKPEFQLSLYPLEFSLYEGTNEWCAICRDEYLVQRQADYQVELQNGTGMSHKVRRLPVCFLHVRTAMNALMSRERVVWRLEEVQR